MGPRETTAGFYGRYPESDIGIDTISREEKLLNPASTFTSFATKGISLNHSRKRSVDNALKRRLSSNRMARANLGTIIHSDDALGFEVVVALVIWVELCLPARGTLSW